MEPKYNNNFVLFPVAEKLKELGFDEKCFAYYYQSGLGEIDIMECDYGEEVRNYELRMYKFLCKAPLIQQAIKFIKEKKQILIRECFYGGFEIVTQYEGNEIIEGWHGTLDSAFKVALDI